MPLPLPRTTPLRLGAGSGVLLAAATAPGPAGPLAFVALAPFLIAALRAGSVRGGAAAGAACGLVFYGVGFAWGPLEMGGRLLWAAYLIGVPLLAASLAALGAGLAALALRGRSGLALAATPAAWLALETGRASGSLGIPLLRLGDALGAWPSLAQPAALGGVALLGAWIAGVNAALALGVLQPQRRAAALALLALLALPAPIGALRLARAADAAKAGGGLRVAAVQPDVPARERWVPARFDTNLERLLALSRAALPARPELVVWPESAFESTGFADGHPFLGAIANQLGAPLLAGLRRPVPGGPPGARWNSAALALPGGTTRVAGDKVRPVPVYERAPESPLARRLAAAGWWPGRVLPARAAGLVEVPREDGAPVRVGVLLCIDAAHPELARELRRRGAELLVNPANEAEPGSWVARQHATLARLRAIETGLPLVRVANTGPSAWSDGLGRLHASIAPQERAVHVAEVAVPLVPTLWVRWGATPVWLAVLAPIAAALAASRGAAAISHSSVGHALHPLRGGERA